MRNPSHFRRLASANALRLLTLAWLVCLLACSSELFISREPVLVLGARGNGPTEFEKPRAVAVSPVDSTLVVIDRLGRVQLFNPKMVNNRTLGGVVPIRDKTFRFTKNAYIAGDCGSIEEATTAMLEGGLAGLYVADALGLGIGVEESDRGVQAVGSHHGHVADLAL